MPTYEYRCDNCKHEFEKFQSITSGPIRKCPKCGKKKVKRLISSGAGMIFKGSGFYITDYRDQGYKDKAKADSGSSTDGAAETKSSDAAKPETKPAAESKTPAEVKPKAEPKSKPDSGGKKSKSRDQGEK